MNSTNKLYRDYIRAFLLSFGIAFLFIFPFILRGGGILYVVDDFNLQQIPFNVISNYSVKSGNIFWSWNTDLGSQFIGSYSFYTLGSPFFWLSCLFPSKLFPYLIGPLLILKYAVAGLTSFAFIRRFTNHMESALIGCLLYAFSSFQLSSMTFNHFLDVAAFFPLLLIALEEYMQNDRKGVFVLSVAVCALINYFFFVGQVIFLFIYFFVKFFSGDFKTSLRKFFGLVLESLLGVGISCCLFIPSILFTLQVPRATNGFFSIRQMLQYNTYTYLTMLTGALLPAQVLHGWSICAPYDFSTTQCFLPLFGLFLVAAFCIRKRKSWLTRVIGVSILFYVIPVLNSLFYAGNSQFYGRWLYMLTLMFALASAKALDDETIKIKKPFFVVSFLYILFLLYLFYVSQHYKTKLVYNELYLVFQLLLLFCGVLATVYLLSYRSDRMFFQKATAFTAVFIVLSGSFVFYGNQKLYPSPKIFTKLYTDAPKYAHFPDSQNYRIDTLACYRNVNLLLDKPSIGSFNSTVNGSLFHFYDAIGAHRDVTTQLPYQAYGLRPFLSTRYILKLNNYPNNKYQGNYGDITLPDLKLTESTEIYKIYESEDFIPMGFTFDSYTTEGSFFRVPEKDRHLALLKALVLTPEQAKRYSGELTEIPQSRLYDLTQDAYHADVAARKTETCTNFKRYNQGFSASINLSKPNLVFFSVPYDSYWSAKVNGKPARIEKVDFGMMAVECPAGNNSIQFSYKPQSYTIGLAVTAASLLAFALYLIICHWTGKRKTKEAQNNAANEITV